MCLIELISPNRISWDSQRIRLIHERMFVINAITCVIWLRLSYIEKFVRLEFLNFTRIQAFYGF